LDFFILWLCVVRIQVIVGDWNIYNVLFLHKKPSVCRALSPLLILGYGVEREGHLSLKLFVGEVQAAGNEDRQLVQVSCHKRQPV
jgi:hypothetical protein